MELTEMIYWGVGLLLLIGILLFLAKFLARRNKRVEDRIRERIRLYLATFGGQNILIQKVRDREAKGFTSYKVSYVDRSGRYFQRSCILIGGGRYKDQIFWSEARVHTSPGFVSQ